MIYYGFKFDWLWNQSSRHTYFVVDQKANFITIHCFTSIYTIKIHKYWIGIAEIFIKCRIYQSYDNTPTSDLHVYE